MLQSNKLPLSANPWAVTNIDFLKGRCNILNERVIKIWELESSQDILRSEGSKREGSSNEYTTWNRNLQGWFEKDYV